MARLMSKRETLAAAHWLLARRHEGVPSVITAHEAWVLTEGATGTEGDHGTPVPLSRCAVAVAKSRAT